MFLVTHIPGYDLFGRVQKRFGKLDKPSPFRSNSSKLMSVLVLQNVMCKYIQTRRIMYVSIQQYSCNVVVFYNYSGQKSSLEWPR